MAMQQIKSPLTNPDHIEVWRRVCTTAVKQNPNSQADLFLQLAVNELNKMFVLKQEPDTTPLQKRKEICDYISAAGKTGHPRGMFFEALTLLGFGCQPDVATSQALLRVAAYRNCALALDHLMWRLGHTKLAQANLMGAIPAFKKAGAIAAPELGLIQNHLDSMRARYAQQQAATVVLEESPKVVSLASLRMS